MTLGIDIHLASLGVVETIGIFESSTEIVVELFVSGLEFVVREDLDAIGQLADELCGDWEIVAHIFLHGVIHKFDVFGGEFSDVNLAQALGD